MVTSAAALNESATGAGLRVFRQPLVRRILHLLPYGRQIDEEIRKGVARRRLVAPQMLAVEAEGGATGAHHGAGLHCLTPLQRGPCHYTAATSSWTPSLKRL